MNLPSLRRGVGGFIVAALVLVSCGGSDEGESGDASPDSTAAEAAQDDETTANGSAEAEPDDRDSAGDEDSAPSTGEAEASDSGAATDEGDSASGADASEDAEGEPNEEIVGIEIPERQLVITTNDGEQLTGTIFGMGEVGVVLAHMRGRDQTTWFDFARRAASNGYQVLAFDFRGYGGSTGERDTSLDVDLAAAVAGLGNEGATQIIVMGASMGGTATVNVAGQLDLAGAVSISAPADFLGLDALDVAVNVGEPLLVIAAEDDQPYADAAVGIDDRAPASQLILFEGNAHGTNIFGTNENELTNLLLSFVRDHVS